MKEFVLLALFAAVLVLAVGLVLICIACDRISEAHKRLFDDLA